MRSGCMRSTVPHLAQTRAGGRWRSPHCSQRPPTNPNFQPSLRSDGGAAGATGSGRRGGSRSRKPRHVRNVSYERPGWPLATCSATVRCGRIEPRASVVRKMTASAPSATWTTATSCPGSARSSTSARTRPGCAVPVLPIAAAGRRPGPRGVRRGPRDTERTARVCGPVTITWSSASGVISASLQASANAACASGTYACSPKRSSHTCDATSPGSRHRSRNSSVDAPRPTTCVCSAGEPCAMTKATAPSPPSRSSALPGRPVRTSAQTTSTGSVDRPPACIAPMPERVEPAMS